MVINLISELFKDVDMFAYSLSGYKCIDINYLYIKNNTLFYKFKSSNIRICGFTDEHIKLVTLFLNVNISDKLKFLTKYTHTMHLFSNINVYH